MLLVVLQTWMALTLAALVVLAVVMTMQTAVRVLQACVQRLRRATVARLEGPQVA